MTTKELRGRAFVAGGAHLSAAAGPAVLPSVEMTQHGRVWGLGGKADSYGMTTQKAQGIRRLWRRAWGGSAVSGDLGVTGLGGLC